MSEKKLRIYTDGACRGNPGPGSWGVLMVYDGTTAEFGGAQPETTNNRMELTAVIEALSRVKRCCPMSLTTDSLYLRDGVTQWLTQWKRNGWKTSRRKPVKNVDLWKHIDMLASRHAIGLAVGAWSHRASRQRACRYDRQRTPGSTAGNLRGQSVTRQVVLDTETTGLEAAKGHRIVEIGCIELVDRQEGETFHQLINPERDISAGRCTGTSHHLRTDQGTATVCRHLWTHFSSLCAMQRCLRTMRHLIPPFWTPS